MSKTINLGAVTAYADAVAAGYTGTREEFAQDLANAATYAAESHADAEAASDAAETATAAASAASLDADAAHDDAATAHSDAEAALSFKQAAETAATTATTKAGEATNSASQAATSASGAAGSATAASGSATNAAASETAAASSATSAAGSASAAAQTLVDVNAAGATQIAAIGAKGEEVLESIPADYTTLSNDVDDLKSDLNNTITQSVNLLNPSLFQPGKYIVNGGDLADNETLTASGFFPVNGGTQYYMYRSMNYTVRVAYYTDADVSAFISMDASISASVPGFVTPANARYVRLSANSNMIQNMGVYASDIGYYIPYQVVLKENVSIVNQIDKTLTDSEKASPADIVGELKAHVILPEKCYKFGDDSMIVDERLELENGNIVTNSTNQTRTDFIPVNVGDYVQTCAIRYICLYDEHYQYLGYINLWSMNDSVAPPSTYSGNYRSNLTRIEAIDGVNPAYIRCWGVYNQYPPAITFLSSDPYKVVNLGDSIFGNNEKPWDLGTFIQNITGLKDANCGYGGTTARVIPSGNMSPLGLPSIVDCIVSGDFSSLQTPAYWADLGEYMYTVPTLLFGMIDFSGVKIITIAYGTNDWRSNTPIDNTDNRLDTSTYKGGLRYAVEQLQTKYPAITLVMLSPIFRYWSDSSDYSTVDRDSDAETNSLNLKLTDYVTAMNEVANEYHLPFFNNYNGIGLNKYTAPTWLRDGTHLNRGIGADKLGHIIAEEVNRIY